MHLSELSMGYGKFEYTREGVNHARGIYPTTMAGCAITSLNSPSDSEIHLSPSPQQTSFTSDFRFAEDVAQYEDCFLCALLFGVPPPDSVGIVPCATLKHPVTDACNVTGNSMSCIVFGYSFNQKMVVIVPKGIAPVQGGNGSCLVDRFQNSAVPWFPPSVTATATEFLMFDQPAVTPVLSGRWKSVSIYHTGHDLHRTYRADAIDLLLEAHQLVLPGKLAKASFVLLFAPTIQSDILLEDIADEAGALPLVPMAKCECLLLVQDPNPRADNIFIGTHQKSQVIQCAVAVIHFLEKAGPEQFTEFPCIDFIGLRAMEE